jgi:hypothetical protein
LIPPWKDPVELFELSAGSLIAVAAFLRPRLWSRTLSIIESRVYRLAGRPTTSVALVGIVSFLGSAGASLLTRMPQPMINDEFAHLLAADTFASGRVSNPTHPMWVHFETYHVNQEPSYVSKFPPAQGLMLGLGQIVGGLPIVGVWLSSGLACAAICWMLQAWFRPGIAFIGALLAITQIGVFSYWTQSFWGGMMPALGSALLFGGMKRVLARPNVGVSIVAAAGLAILANSRPFEGALACLPVLALLGFSLFRQSATNRAVMIRRVLMPICGAGLVTLAAMGYYNFKQTGDPLVTAYQVNAATYQVQPIFRWGAFREPTAYHHAIMRKYYSRDLTSAQLKSLIQAKGPTARRHILNLWQFYGGIPLALPFLAGVIAIPLSIWPAAATVLVVCGGLIFSSAWVSPHYAAPMTGPFFILVTWGWKRLREFRFKETRTGLFLARGVVVLAVTAVCVRVLVAHIQPDPAAPEWPYQRAAIERQLERTAGYHLILVRYTESHHPEEEWVYNKADIDRSRVVWAREMDAGDNQALLDYFHGRSVWLVQPDVPSGTLVPYPSRSLHDQSNVATVR